MPRLGAERDGRDTMESLFEPVEVDPALPLHCVEGESSMRLRMTYAVQGPITFGPFTTGANVGTGTMDRDYWAPVANCFIDTLAHESFFGRKLDVEAQRRAVPLSVFFFDCLLRDGAPLVDRGARERHDILREALPAELVTPSLITRERDDAERFYREALARGHEGLMAKALYAPYEAGRRGAGWLKLKRAHTLDLVVIAAEWGHGRRRGWLSNLHLGARDPASGGFVMLGKTFKGMTYETLRWQTETFPPLATRTDGWVMHLRPQIVAEIAFNEIQSSSRYAGGLALRFARLVRYRPDKAPEEADTIDAVRELFAAQSGQEASL